MKKSKSVKRTPEGAKAFKKEREAKARVSETLRKSEFLEAMRLLGNVKAKG